MRLAALLGATIAAFAFISPALAGDRVAPTRTAAFIGDQFEITIEVETAPGAVVELDPAAPSWSGVEVVRIVAQTVTPAGDRALHRLTLVVAAFQLGDLPVAPGVIVTTGVDVEQRTVPPFVLRVSPTLPASAPLELSPLAAASSIGGGESPLLRPALWTGAVVAVLLFLALAWLAGRSTARRLQRPKIVGEITVQAPDLGTAESLIATDPVNAYKALGTIVRGELARRYGFPAVAMTTNELQRRMEAEGVERWEARLVFGLLQECDAVIYAGYRPAPERREADLTTAREIVGAS